MSFVDKLCKQFGPRSGPTKRRAWSGSKLIDTQLVFLKEFFEKVDFEKKSADNKKHEKYPGGQEWTLILLILLVLKIMSAHNVYCIYSYALWILFVMEANNINLIRLLLRVYIDCNIGYQSTTEDETADNIWHKRRVKNHQVCSLFRG